MRKGRERFLCLRVQSSGMESDISLIENMAKRSQGTTNGAVHEVMMGGNIL